MAWEPGDPHEDDNNSSIPSEWRPMMIHKLTLMRDRLKAMETSIGYGLNQLHEDKLKNSKKLEVDKSLRLDGHKETQVKYKDEPIVTVNRDWLSSWLSDEGYAQGGDVNDSTITIKSGGKSWDFSLNQDSNETIDLKELIEDSFSSNSDSKSLSAGKGKELYEMFEDLEDGLSTGMRIVDEYDAGSESDFPTEQPMPDESDIKQGDTWAINGDGEIHGEPFESGDLITAKTNNPDSSDTSDWIFIQRNVDYATKSRAGLVKLTDDVDDDDDDETVITPKDLASQRYIKGQGVKKITVGNEPDNPDHGDLWVVALNTAKNTYIIDHDKVDESVKDFPVYLDLSEAGSAFWDTVRSEGQDIRVYQDGDEVPREVVWIDKEEKEGEVYAKVDISSSEDTEIVVEVDSLADGYSDGSSYGKHNVWDNDFLSVIHGEDEKDSTSNGNDMEHFSDVSASEEEGHIGKGMKLRNGKRSAIPYGSDEMKGISILSQRIGGVWSAGVSGGKFISDDGSGSVSSYNNFVIQHGPSKENHNDKYPYEDDSNGLGDYYINGNKNNPQEQTESNEDQWNHATFNFDVDTGDKVYFGTTRTGAAKTTNLNFDEVRVHSTERSEAWAKAEYENLINSSDFYSVNEEEGSLGSNPIWRVWDEAEEEWKDFKGAESYLTEEDLDDYYTKTDKVGDLESLTIPDFDGILKDMLCFDISDEIDCS